MHNRSPRTDYKRILLTPATIAIKTTVDLTKAAAWIVGLFYLVRELRRNLPALLNVEVVSSMPGGMARRGVYVATVGLLRQFLTKLPASLHAAQLRLARPAPLPVAMAAHKHHNPPFATVSFAWLC